MKVRKVMQRVVGAAAVATLAVGAAAAEAAPSVVTAAGPLSDLSSAGNATDGAYGRLYAISPGDGTTRFVFVLTGLSPAAAGNVYGAHVHVGPCVAGNGPAALGHYNTGSGGPPSTANEVWLDFVVQPGGWAVAQTTVPFEIDPGTARSVVVHADPTQHGTGLAGGRIACLPVAF